VHPSQFDYREDEMDDQEESQTSAPAEDDALKDADIKSGTGDPELAHPEQQGEAGPASGTSPETEGGP
jgi:hypothetical protein